MGMQTSIPYFFLLLVLFFTSCAPRRSGAVHVMEPETLLNVREVVYVLKSSFCPVIIQVNRDGSYVLKRWRIDLKDQPPKIYSGKISSHLLNELARILSSKTIQDINGVPTYDFDPEDSHHRPPTAILDLFEAVYPRSR